LIFGAGDLWVSLQFRLVCKAVSCFNIRMTYSSESTPSRSPGINLRKEGLQLLCVAQVLRNEGVEVGDVLLCAGWHLWVV